MRTIRYNGFDLNTDLDTYPSYTVRTITDGDAPGMQIQTETLATRNGSKFLSRYFTTKTIRVDGNIRAMGKASLQGAIDAWKAAMNAQEANLDIEMGDGTIRRFKATPDVISAPRDTGNHDFVGYSVEFVCSDPFGRALLPVTIAHEGITSSPASFTDSFIGSAPQTPIITIEVVAETNLTQIEVENQNTGERIIVGPPVALTTGDIIVINCVTGDVTLNGNDVEFTGYFPEYRPGNNTTVVYVTDTGAFEVDVTIEYTPQYL